MFNLTMLKQNIFNLYRVDSDQLASEKSADQDLYCFPPCLFVHPTIIAF